MTGQEHPPKLLVINPGSTTTKIAVFVAARAAFETNIAHPRQALLDCGDIIEQQSYRRAAIEKVLAKEGFGQTVFDAYVGRGGLLRPIDGGCWMVNTKMLNDLRSCKYGRHASNLGAIIAQSMAEPFGRPAYVVDPVVVDELCQEARFTGHPAIVRRSIFHALSHKAVAGKLAKRLAKRYDRSRLIVAHMGGGITVGAHCNGRVIDVNNALDGEGPFTPERTGALPHVPFLREVTRLGWSVDQAAEWTVRHGGLQAYLGTNDCVAVERRIARGDTEAEAVYKAMAYQIALAIGGCAAALGGRVDAIGLTGGLSRSRMLVGLIRRRVRWIAPVWTYPRMAEMAALAEGVLPVLAGEAKAKVY